MGHEAPQTAHCSRLTAPWPQHRRTSPKRPSRKRERKDPMRFGKLVCLGLLVATCGIVPGVAYARGGMHGDSGTFSRQLLHALSLTDDQQAQVREAFGIYRTTVQPLGKEMRTPRQLLQDVLLNPTGLDS